MDNDRLINEARHLYSVLQVEQFMQSLNNKAGLKHLDRAVIAAYCRYQRRLNRCVLCYRIRLDDCNRGLDGEEHSFCTASTKQCIGRCNKEAYYENDQLLKSL